MHTDAKDLYLGGLVNGKVTSKDKEKNKFNRMAKIQSIYPEIDQKLRDIIDKENKHTIEKACAFSVLLMISTGIRIGNEGSAEGYISKAPKTLGQILKTYGLTTLLHEHIDFRYSSSLPYSLNNGDPTWMILNFVGKKSVEHEIYIGDTYLIKFGLEFYDLNHPIWLTGYDKKLKEYRPLEVNDLRKFIKKRIGRYFTPKDFRTFRGNIEAARTSKELLKHQPEKFLKKDLKEEIKEIITSCAEVLGNTNSASKKSYINPEILEKHMNARGFNLIIKKRKNKKKEIIEKIGE